MLYYVAVYRFLKGTHVLSSCGACSKKMFNLKDHHPVGKSCFEVLSVLLLFKGVWQKITIVEA